MLEQENTSKNKDYEEIVTKLISDNERNLKFDEKYVELKEFISNNYKKKRISVIDELHARLEELKSISKHRLANLLLDKSLFPFIYEQKTTFTALKFAKIFSTEMRKTLGIRRISKKEGSRISRMMESSKKKNILISKLENYLLLKIEDEGEDEDRYNNLMALIKSFENYLVEIPIMNNLINTALLEEDHRSTNRLMRLHEESDNDLIQLFNQKKYDWTVQKVSKNPKLYSLLFEYWYEIASNNNLYYKNGKRKGECNDSAVLKWILNLMGIKYVTYKNSEFRRIQKGWNKYKNSHF